MAPALQLPPLTVESRQASSPKPPNLAPLSSNTTDPSLKHLKLNGVGSSRNKVPQVVELDTMGPGSVLEGHSALDR
ncbi:putative Aspartic proteinase nepenthesin-1 precursor [Corchorus olitorius]|uniref:Aspartic proteinase nepenthesin-1 n=1 Tax=Corchorus olitorius TaxID=93759 RepID=A0A1R3JZF7_9ROSI|nr:putative Aspartic proteinase nepenthesin-1 precursor [Corchorus olitorius]